MASGKQLLNVLQKLAAQVEGGETLPKISFDDLMVAKQAQKPQKPKIEGQPSYLMVDEEKIPTSATKEIGLDKPVAPDIPSYYGDTQVEKSQPDFMIEMLEEMATDPNLKRVAKGTMPDLDDISEELGTTTPKPKSPTEIARQLKSDKKTLKTGRWPKGGRLKDATGIKARIARNEKKINERQAQLGNPKDTDVGPNVLGETAGPIEKGSVPKPVIRQRDAEGNLAKYESTEGAISPKLNPSQSHLRELEQFDDWMAGKPVSPIGKQLPPGRAKGAGPVDVEKSKQAAKPKGRDDDDVTSREMANELSVESDPNVIRKMQDLDIMGDEHEFMMQRVKDIFKQMPPEVRQSLPQQIALGRNAPTNLRAIIKEVTDAKTVDELAGTIHGRGFRGVDKGSGDVPVSIDNLRATIASAPDSPEKTAALESLDRFSKEVSKKSKGRQTKHVPIVHPNRPKPQPSLVQAMYDRLLGPQKFRDKPVGTQGELFQLGSNVTDPNRGIGGSFTPTSQAAKPKLTEGPSRSMDELSRQRMIEAQQGPITPQQSELFALQKYLQESAESLKAGPTTKTRKAPIMPPEKLVETMNLLDEIEELLGLPRSSTARSKKPLGSRRRLSNEELVDFTNNPNDFY